MKFTKKFRLTIVLAAMALVMFAMFSGASAQGHTSDQLTDAGWNCITAGPHNWVHCFPPGSSSAATLKVKVFGVTGEPFLGAELLIRADVYAGQPCSTDGGGPYANLGDYFACHFFNTGS